MEYHEFPAVMEVLYGNSALLVFLNSGKNCHRTIFCVKKTAYGKACGFDIVT